MHSNGLYASFCFSTPISPRDRYIMKIVRPISSLLIKPAGPDCNLACEYCFYLRKDALFGCGRHRMSEEILEHIIRQALEGGGPQVSFGWQGGEPTLMGLDFFRKAVELQGKYRRRDQSVMNGLQTNGWMIDD